MRPLGSSTDALALTLSGSVRERMLGLTSLERVSLPTPILTVLLDAPDVVLDERLRARGEEIPPWARELRRVYREEIARVCDVVLSTAGDDGRVAERLLSFSQGRTGGLTWARVYRGSGRRRSPTR